MKYLTKNTTIPLTISLVRQEFPKKDVEKIVDGMLKH